jgi:hypothetical protein
MQDEDAIAYWDEMNAPLGLGRVSESAPRHRRIWPALLAAAALAGALAGLAPAAWRVARVHTLVASASVERASPPVEPSARKGIPEAPAEITGLRRTPLSEAAPEPSPPPVRPIRTESSGDPAAGADAGRPRALIINVAEALAAAKLKDAPR